ncbi:MAG TPA: phosphatase PAP2 family protein [Oligoflexus sp.]|uniref:phosphatase PAP2 family protein n=1 Tax=Oligoflexus sp. TaxID=1971216 RepID=UPI002D80FAC7|nr:phosphatase PAP2 family protein [Oligoflexus sp.]HET9241136.1 phosphatase PAP2 family protein [Oligoflexus sp.]
MRRLILPLIEDKAKKRVLVWSAAVFALIYSGLGHCPWTRPVYLPLTDLDRAIPLLPWTLLIYLSDYLFILLVLLSLKKAEDFSTAFYRMIVGIGLSFVIFLFFPTVYPRPLLPADPLWGETFLFLHFLDQPTNCFPSLHVSMTLIAAASMRPSSRGWRAFGWMWALAICLSTLTTRQHYVWDVLGGAAIAWAAWVVKARREP